MKTLGVLAMALMVAACGEATIAKPATPSSVAPRAIPLAGLDRVMGQSAAGLTQLFGTPDADMREGTARKLQFQSSFCVLDTYLYPEKGPGKNGEPVVTYVDTRQPDGSPIDRASCVAAMTKRNGGK